MATKILSKLTLKCLYRDALRKSGFRSFKAANQRRGALIIDKIVGTATHAQLKELRVLTRVVDLYCRYRSGDAEAKACRRLERLARHLKSVEEFLTKVVDGGN